MPTSVVYFPSSGTQTSLKDIYDVIPVPPGHGTYSNVTLSSRTAILKGGTAGSNNKFSEYGGGYISIESTQSSLTFSYLGGDGYISDVYSKNIVPVLSTTFNLYDFTSYTNESWISITNYKAGGYIHVVLPEYSGLDVRTGTVYITHAHNTDNCIISVSIQQNPDPFGTTTTTTTTTTTNPPRGGTTTDDPLGTL